MFDIYDIYILNRPYLGHRKQCLAIKDLLHSINGNNYCIHDMVPDLPKFVEPQHSEIADDFQGPAMAKKIDKAITFGGSICAVSGMKSRFRTSRCGNPMFEFEIAQSGWTTTLPINMEGYRGMRCTPISNGESILIERLMRNSGIICPPPIGEWHAISVRDQNADILAVSGYIRRQWKECGIIDRLFPPKHILNVISNWYWSEYIHIFCADYSPCYRRRDVI